MFTPSPLDQVGLLIVTLFILLHCTADGAFQIKNGNTVVSEYIPFTQAAGPYYLVVSLHILKIKYNYWKKLFSLK